MGAAAGGLVVVAALAFGAVQLLHGQGRAAPSPSTGPSSTTSPLGGVAASPSAGSSNTTPPSNGPDKIAVYAFTTGTQNLTHPTQVTAELKASAFQPVGIDWVIGWQVIEPSPGDYDWSLLAADLAAASSAGYLSIVEIIPGEYAPTWARSECPTVQLTLHQSGPQVTMCVPTSTQFLQLWTQLIAAFGQRYDGHAGLTMVQATGCGIQGEMYLPIQRASFWAPYGVTTQTLLPAWEQVITAWRTALPDTPSSLAIEEPLGTGNSDVLAPLLDYARQQFGANLWVQQNGLGPGTQSTPGSYGGDLAAASQWTTSGWQMHGTEASDGELGPALQRGLAAHPSFYEVYMADVLNPAATTALKQLQSEVTGRAASAVPG